MGMAAILDFRGIFGHPTENSNHFLIFNCRPILFVCKPSIHVSKSSGEARFPVFVIYSMLLNPNGGTIW